MSKEVTLERIREEIIGIILRGNDGYISGVIYQSIFRTNPEESSVWTPTIISGRFSAWFTENNDAKISGEISAEFSVRARMRFLDIFIWEFSEQFLNKSLVVFLMKYRNELLKAYLAIFLKKSLDDFIHESLEEFLIKWILKGISDDYFNLIRRRFSKVIPGDVSEGT